jgi:hypothetical protein
MKERGYFTDRLKLQFTGKMRLKPFNDQALFESGQAALEN